MVGKEPEGGSKKSKHVGNDNSLSSMFAKETDCQRLEQSKRHIQCTTSKEVVHEVKVLILESFNAWKNYSTASQEKDTVKEQCRCNPTEQERTGQ
jgi:hypothetical protein